MGVAEAALLAFLAFSAGVIAGRWFFVRSLLIGADRYDRTPHKLCGQFWYVVPEKEYVRRDRRPCGANSTGG